MKLKLKTLQNKVVEINKTVDQIRLQDEKQFVWINQLEIELKTISDDLLQLIHSIKDE